MTAQPNQDPFSAQPESQKGMSALGDLVPPRSAPDNTQIESAMFDLSRGEAAADRVRACEILGQNVRTESAMLLCEVGLLDRDKRVVDAAVAALRGTEDPVVIKKLESMLFEGRGEHAMSSARVLRGTTYEPLILRLADKLREPKLYHSAPRTWSALLHALGEPKHQVAIRAIIHSAEKCHEPQESAKAILALKGCTDTNALLAVCDKFLLSYHAATFDASVKFDAAIEVLRGVDNPQIVAAIIKSCENPYRATIRALAGTQNEEALEYLISTLDRRTCPPFRPNSYAYEAALALKQTQIPTVTPRLVALAASTETHENTRVLAIQALEDTKDEMALRVLFNLAAYDPSAAVQCEAINSARNGLNLPEAHVLWTHCLRWGNESVQTSVAVVLKDTQNEEALLALCRFGLTANSSPELQKYTVDALRGTKNAAAITWLTEVGLESESSDVRESAALALDGTEYELALEKLCSKILSDEAVTVREAAAKALYMTKDCNAQNVLCAIGLNDAAPGMRARAASALRGCCYGPIIESLFELSHFDTSAEVREAAIGALEMVPDREVLERLQREHTGIPRRVFQD